MKEIRPWEISFPYNVQTTNITHGLNYRKFLFHEWKYQNTYVDSILIKVPIPTKLFIVLSTFQWHSMHVSNHAYGPTFLYNIGVLNIFLCPSVTFVDTVRVFTLNWFYHKKLGIELSDFYLR